MSTPSPVFDSPREMCTIATISRFQLFWKRVRFPRSRESIGAYPCLTADRRACSEPFSVLLLFPKSSPPPYICFYLRNFPGFSTLFRVCTTLGSLLLESLASIHMVLFFRYLVAETPAGPVFGGLVRLALSVNDRLLITCQNSLDSKWIGSLL